MTRYAIYEIVATILLGGGLTALAWSYSPIWALLPLVITAFFLNFYRDPPRRVPRGRGLLVSPADGKIIGIARDLAEGPGPGRWLRITIFLSVFDVHVNRSPCAGRITRIDYRPGKFLNALDDKSSRENEANLLTIAPHAPLPGPIGVRQIAGLLARRIVCARAVGDALETGERFGMIKLGSRTELTVPDDPRWQVRVAIGQRVRGGASVLLEWNEAEVERQSSNGG